MPVFRPDQPLATLAALPRGRLTILPPAGGEPPGPAWSWRPTLVVLQVVIAGRLPIAEAGGGILGQRQLGPGDMLLAMPGSWSRRRYGRERRLFSLSCQPGAERLQAFHYRPGIPLGGPPEHDWLVHGGPDLRATLAGLATCSDPEAAGLIARGIRLLLPQATLSAVDDADARIRRRAAAWLDAWTSGPIGREACAAALGVHPDHLTRCFRRCGGSWRAAAVERQCEQACSLLLGSGTVGEIARACGWDSTSHFIAVFRRRFGTTPQRWRAQAGAS